MYSISKDRYIRGRGKLVESLLIIDLFSLTDTVGAIALYWKQGRG